MASTEAISNPGAKMREARRIPRAERHTQLLAIARQIILRDGVGALTMSALADAAGVTKPIVYRHFNNSEDVVIEILKDYTQESIRFTSKRVRGSKTIYEFLDRIIDSLFDYIKEQDAIVRSITNGFSSSENVDACFLDMQNRALRVYSHLLKQQGVTEKRASLAGYALMEMINSTILEFARKADQDDRETLKEMVRGTVRALVRGRGTRPQLPANLLDSDGV